MQPSPAMTEVWSERVFEIFLNCDRVPPRWIWCNKPFLQCIIFSTGHLSAEMQSLEIPVYKFALLQFATLFWNRHLTLELNVLYRR